MSDAKGANSVAPNLMAEAPASASNFFLQDLKIARVLNNIRRLQSIGYPVSLGTDGEGIFGYTIYDQLKELFRHNLRIADPQVQIENVDVLAKLANDSGLSKESFKHYLLTQRPFGLPNGFEEIFLNRLRSEFAPIPVSSLVRSKNLKVGDGCLLRRNIELQR